MSRAVIVGGGIAGLSVALRLQQQGVEVRVLERASRAGGMLSSSSADGFVREHAAHGLLGGDTSAVLAMCEELGVEVVEASASAGRRWIYAHGRLHEFPTHPLAFARSGLLSWRGKLDVAGGPLRGPGRQGFDETVGSFARRRFGVEAAETLIAPLVNGVYAGDIDALSLRASIPALAEMDARGGLLLGAVKHGMARRAGSHRLAAPRDGAAELARALARELGDALELGAAATAIAYADDRPRVVLAGGDTREADVVVLAAPAYVAARLLEASAPAFAAVARGITYAPAAVVNLGFEGSSIAHALDGAGFLVAPGSGLRILGCAFESVLWPGRAPRGKVLLRCILGGTGDPSACEQPDGELIDAACEDLDAALGLRRTPVHAHVARWPAAIAQYNVGHVERVERAELIAGAMGVVLAGSGYRGVTVNQCVANAGRVVRDVIARLGAVAAAAALVLLAFAACSGSGGKQVENGAQRDGGDAAVEGEAAAPSATTPEGAAPPYVVGKLTADGRLSGSGSVKVQVSWPEPPPGLLRPRGANPCGVTHAPAVSVHTLHGLRGAVVELEGIERGVAPADAATTLVAMRDCAPQPRVQVMSRLGATLAVANDDPRRHELTITRLEDGEAVARAPMPLIGQRFELGLDEPGHYRVASAADADAAWVVVPAHPYVSVTDEKGRVRFEEVPPGTYRVVAWHPPVVAGQQPLRATGEVTVKPGAAAELTLEPGAP